MTSGTIPPSDVGSPGFTKVFTSKANSLQSKEVLRGNGES